MNDKQPSSESESHTVHSGMKEFYHGSRKNLSPGDVVTPGGPFGIAGDNVETLHTYMSPNLDAAIWAAELAEGNGPPKVYIVETEGDIEDATELLVESAPRHPYMSHRSKGRVRVKSEVREWTYYHGTRADLEMGDMLMPGGNPNFGKKALGHIYLARTLDAAVWGAELALGDGPERIYIVEATGPIEDDPNVTNKRFPGNPTKSFRSHKPLRVIGEVKEWQGHPKEALEAMKAGIAELAKQGIGPLDD